MTAVEYLFETLWDCPKDKLTWYTILEQAKEMEKQQIIDAFWNGDNSDCTSEQNSKEFADKYYNETYGSKGSDEHHEDTLDEITTSSQTEIKDNKIMLLEEDLWCIHKYLDDLNIERNDMDGKQYSIVGRIKLLENRFLYQMSELETNLSTSQTEISDEEIKEVAYKYKENELEDTWEAAISFMDGAKWYREQLKKKQC